MFNKYISHAYARVAFSFFEGVTDVTHRLFRENAC